MEKQLRRQDYAVKRKHQKKSPYHKQNPVDQTSFQKIKRSDLSGLITFLNEEYQETIRKNQNIENELNKAIIKRVQQLKRLWISFHKERLLTFLKQHNIPLEYDNSMSLQANANKISFIKNFLYINKRLTERENKQNGYVEITNLLIMQDKYRRTYYPFYCKDFDQRINFKINFKRMLKDSIYQCNNFQALVQDVQRELKITWKATPN